MASAIFDTRDINRTQPTRGIALRERQFVRDLQTLKRARTSHLVISYPTAVGDDGGPNKHDENKNQPGRFHLSSRFQIETVKRQIGGFEKLYRSQHDKSRNTGYAERHQHRDNLIDVPDRKITRRKYDRCEYLFRPRKRIVPGNRFLNRSRWLPETPVKSIIRADAHAIHAFHAARIDDHSVLFHFLMHDHIRCTCCRAVPALITCVRYADLSRRDLISQTEEPAVRACVGAKSFRTQKIYCHEPTNEQERNGDPKRRECRPEICRNDVVSECRKQRQLVRFGQRARDRRPHEHIKGDDQRDED